MQAARRAARFGHCVPMDMLWFIDYPSKNGPRLFAERVLPALRGAL
jgi:hypothetical protein